MRWTIQDACLGTVSLQATWWMPKGANAISIRWQAESSTALSAPLQLILRPDLECRSFHEESHLTPDIDQTWGSLLKTHNDGFVWDLSERGRLLATAEHGSFHRSGDVLTGIAHPFEATRGQTAAGDAWSPGFFRLGLDQSTTISFAVATENVGAPDLPKQSQAAPQPISPPNSMRGAFARFGAGLFSATG